MGNMLGSKTQRNSNIELLRLICMFFVVASHIPAFATTGIFSMGLTLNKSILSLFRLGGGIGVDIFVLISGYFLINSKFFLTRIVKLAAEVWIYSVSLYIIMCLTGNASFSVSDFVHSLLPITYNQYWFITAYMIMSLFAPLLNIALKSLGKTGHLRITVLALACFSVIPTALNLIYAYSLRNVTLPETDIYSAPVYFIILYSVGAYIRLYGVNISRAASVIAVCAGVLGQLIVVASLYLISNVNEASYWDIDLLIEANSSFQTAAAFGIFTLVIAAKPRVNKVINFISGGAFGVYVIHETPSIRNWLWKTVFTFDAASSTISLVGKILAVSALIFIGCIIIDLIRKHLVERPLFALIGGRIDALWDKIKNKIRPKEKADGKN